ncbi:TGF-beta receptor type-2 isoform X1 [Triplophysa dalaica]|uniref:TGF-beta receptor type-2 isoform X1 n=2 Tax=Triplophysa dalaica TaxID=1582913 RepID=UPI0024DF5FEB|nr:TGF-beta receptor type-2 isoform X1 [Triplophysa dalaica]
MGCRGWSLWVQASLLLCFCLLQAKTFTLIQTNFCKWCNHSSPICEDNVCTSNCSLSSYCELTEEVCVAIWRKDNASVSVRTMCYNPQNPLENIILANYSTTECLMTPQPSDDGLMYICACIGDQECNDQLIFDKGPNGYSKLKSKDVIPVVVISLVPPLLVAIIATLIFYLYRTRKPSKPKDWAPRRTHYQCLDPAEACAYQANGSDYRGKLHSNTDDVNSEISSTCGNNLNHNTEQLPIQLETIVGKGRFAEVWRARLSHKETGQYETVAVKIFPAVEYTSWYNERAIFSDANLKHENVVQFLTAQERCGTSQKQYWLIMAYYSLGNLQDFLVGHIITWAELCALAGSVARGLAHLHSDTTPCGTPKVPVAHRDLKSSNIVLKSRSECALCDFGLALRLDFSLTVDDFANSGQVGTARYMAPEVLESRVNLEDLESFKQMDVYSMALVLWEMVSRCDVIGEVKNYEPPFGSKVCEQPCVDSMRDLVLKDRGRPDIPECWTTHPGMQFLCATITECWDHDPEARLTAYCVVERFNTLAQEELENSITTHTPVLTSTEQQTPSLPCLPPCTDHSTGEHPPPAADTQISASSRQPSPM